LAPGESEERMASVECPTVHLRNGGVSLVLAADPWGLPQVIHWGAEVNEQELETLVRTASPAVLNSALDAPRSFSVVATRAHGWSASPAVEWHKAGRAIFPTVLRSVASFPTTAELTVSDEGEEVIVDYQYKLDDAGVLAVSAEVTHAGIDGVLDVSAVRALLPLPARARDILDFTGRWSGERRPQHRPVQDGAWRRVSRRGRPGHDAAFVTVVGTPGLSFRQGEAWALHVAWSGDHEQLVERLPEGAGVHSAVLGGGEHLESGSVRLGVGATYLMPPSLFTWSDEGLDGLSRRFHRHVRAMAARGTRPRPLVLNTWEAVYFDQGMEKLSRLAERAAVVGVERFVLDDGWFRGRRNDRAGLGDWYVDEGVWPEGLGALSGLVHALGMEFGLWFEPEMVNPESDLARAHPTWLLGEQAGLTWRHQFALNLCNPKAYAYVLERVDELVCKYGIDFIKWDHNRDLHAARDDDSGAVATPSQTRALYSLIDELRDLHPELEIESCASGGARADLGILSRTQRVWASDTNDPIERQSIQRWTQLLLPPEVIGSHVGPAEAHTTHRVSTLDFRLVTALFQHAGIECDLTACSSDEIAAIGRWSTLYKELRPLLHSGETVRADHVDEGALLHGVVNDAKTHAIFAWVRLDTSAAAHTPRVLIPGLDPGASYLVRLRPEVGTASRHQVADPAWLCEATAGIVLSGGAMTRHGLPMPLLNPGHAMLLEMKRVDQGQRWGEC